MNVEKENVFGFFFTIASMVLTYSVAKNAYPKIKAKCEKKVDEYIDSTSSEKETASTVETDKE